ncbi:hypothetical protein O9993_11045 [Vibrio lentus]|nr:hypothetical protein [Vibrio lentus]
MQKPRVRIPGFEKLNNDRILYAHASRILHLETNPYSRPCSYSNVMVTASYMGKLAPIPLLQLKEMDYVFGLAYKRVPHPMYGKQRFHMT